MSKKIVVTCPNCDHTHKVELDLKELEINPSDKEYDLSQVERILGLSRETLKRYIYSGRLKAEKSGSGKGGSKWMVKATNIAEFRRKRAHQQKT